MEHVSSFNKQLGNEITARVVMNKEIKLLKDDIDKNIAEGYYVDIEIKRNKKIILGRQKKIEIILIFL